MTTLRKVSAVVLMSVLLIACGGEGSDAANTHTGNDVSQDQSAELKLLKTQNCGNRPTPFKPNLPLLPSYLPPSYTPLSFLNSVSMNNLRVHTSSSPYVSTRCSGGYCDVYTYDSDFRLVEWNYVPSTKTMQRLLTYNSDGTLKEITYYIDGAAYPSTFLYDSELRLISISSNSGATATFEYSETGQVVNHNTGSNNYIATYCDNGNLLILDDLYNGFLRGTTTFKYDQNGRRVSAAVTNSNNPKITLYQYDSSNNLIAEQMDGIGRLEMDGVIDFIQTYEYDQYGSVTRKYGYYPQLNIYEGNYNWTYTYIIN